jgi:large subunit ribosomal protein L28
MPSKCDLTAKRLLVGHRVSHSQVKTKRAFKVNVQNMSLYSETLKKRLKLSIATSTLRSIEHNGGIDNFLINSSNSKLTPVAVKLKKQIIQAKEGSVDASKSSNDSSEAKKAKEDKAEAA